MPIDSDLQAAGRRAAAQPVPSAPSVSTLEAGAAKHTSRRRLLMSGAAMVVLVALAFPLALTMRGTTTVQTVAAGTGQAAAAQTDPVPPAAQGDTDADEGNTDADESVRIQVRSGDDFALTIRVISGDQASGAGAAAASAATETLEVDDMTVWISGTGDERTVSALVEPDEFVEVTGSAAQLDMLIEVLRNGGHAERGDRNGVHGFDGLDDAQWQQFFDQFENGEFGGFFGPDSEFNFEDFFGPNSEFNFDGDFEGFEHFFGPNSEFNFDGDFEGFEHFFGPDSEFNFDGDFDGFSFDGDFGEFFGPDGFTFPAGMFGEGFDGCILIDHSGGNDGEPMRIEIPEGCSSTG